MVEYKTYLIAVCCILGVSCAMKRNELGQVRLNVSPEKKCTNEAIAKFIDTSSIYLQIKVDNKEKGIFGINDSTSVADLKNYLKFYGNGKVGMFNQLNHVNETTINPKNAVMGLYCLNTNGFNLEFIFYHIQSGVFKSKYSFLVKGDTIITCSENSSKGVSHSYTYLKTKISPHLLKYKPDW